MYESSEEEAAAAKWVCIVNKNNILDKTELELEGGEEAVKWRSQAAYWRWLKKCLKNCCEEENKKTIKRSWKKKTKLKLTFAETYLVVYDVKCEAEIRIYL